MHTRRDFQELTKLRLDDAILLLQQRRYSAAYYLAGYSVEAGLKACICRQFREDAIPDKKLVNEIYTHDLDKLVKLAGLEQDRNKQSPIFKANWGIVKDWSESSRYKLSDQIAATSLLRAIEDEHNGILQWIRSHW